MTGTQFFVMFLLIVPVAILNGFVISELWSWFIVPLGVTQIGIAQGCGINVLLMYLMHHHALADHSDESTYWPAIIRMVLVPLMFWGIGGIYHYFMHNSWIVQEVSFYLQEHVWIVSKM